MATSGDQGVEPTPVSFRESAEARKWSDPYEPPILCLIPIHLRSRVQYYDEIAASVRAQIGDAYERRYDLSETREQFEKSWLAEQYWRIHSPPWWGLNDIVGFIDVRVCVRSEELQASLFLPKKRIYRRLRNKEPYLFRRMERAELSGLETNDELRSKVNRIVRELCSDERVRRCHIDLTHWQLLLNHIDLRSFFRQAAERDLQLLSEKKAL